MTDEQNDNSGASEPRKPRGRRIILAATALLLLMGVAYGADLYLGRGEMARGTEVLGVEVGGMERGEALAELRQALSDRETAAVPVLAGDVETTVVPAEAGLSFDLEATVEQAAHQPLNPLTRLASLFREREVPAARTIDEAALTATMERLVSEIDREPQPGGIAFEGARAIPIIPQQGQQLLAETARGIIAQDWPLGVPLVLPTDITDVELTEDDIDRAMREIAEPALATPLVVTGTSGTTATLPPEQVGEVLRFEADGPELRHSFDQEAAIGILAPQLASTEYPARDATVALGNAGPYVVADRSGSEIDWEATLDGFDELMLRTEERAVDAEYVEIIAEFRTADAEALGINEVIAEYTTGGFATESGVNIRQAAREVNGAVVKPGETFSLNGYTGPRGTAQGYIESGIILNGRPSEAVGGGISQFATTLYNASYFAGMDDVEHQEHSYYISRYPAGREATVWEGAIDVKFHNPYSTGILIQSFGDSSSVTVRIWGTKTVNVQSINGGRWAYTSPSRITLPEGPNCYPSSGAQGFTTSDTRVVRNALTGAEISRTTRTVRYDPQPIVECE
ncbi:VanW family protein [Lolliginicoccus suaedae]|uniref:VanW family protein n=1 Tax=Lolliginicoccus suaedae TaxID=2605429 RepID=UPI001F3EEF22|nr:VanW family protein [Lolliginicoccus suaedae]